MEWSIVQTGQCEASREGVCEYCVWGRVCIGVSVGRHLFVGAGAQRRQLGAPGKKAAGHSVLLGHAFLSTWE